MTTRAICSVLFIVVAAGCGPNPAPATSIPAASEGVETPAATSSATGATSSAAGPTPVPATQGQTVVAYRRPAKPPIPVRLIDSVASGAQLRQATTTELRNGENAIQGESDQSVVLLGPREVLLTWVGTVCERGYAIAFDARGVIVTPDPRPGCDTGRVLYACVLTLSSDVPTGFALDLRRPVILGG